MEKQKLGFARFRTLAESTRSAVLCTDEGGAIRYCSSRAADLFGYAPDDLLAQKISRLITSDNLTATHAPATKPLQATGQRVDGSSFPIDLTVISVDHDGSRALVWVVGSQPDIPQLEDDLTGLPSREFSLESLRERLEQAKATLSHFALLLIGLDGFDALNRKLGRKAGDAVLRETASRLRDGVPKADLIGRMGGAEFCVIAHDPGGPSEVDALAHMLAESLAYPVEHEGELLHVKPHIGVALAPADGDTTAALVANAQGALDKAKLDGVSCRFFGSEVSARLSARRELQAAIRAAIDAGQFHLDFLPVIDLASGVVTGAEALLRWQHPQRGQIAPLEFIPLAEESGLMVPIGAWVMREALRCAKLWSDAGHALRVSVNVTSRQLHAPGFVRQLAAALAGSGCAPDRLELELTEGVAMQHAATVQMTLAEVRKAGVRIALDDFGTGYSSMAYLKSLPVDVIKIDRSFVDGVPHDNANSSIVRAIVAFALCTGREVRAEGVSSVEQARWLHAEGCDAAQGFFFSKPIAQDAFGAWLDNYTAESRALGA